MLFLLTTGGLHDITGSYDLPMVLVSGVFALSGVLFSLIPIMRYIKSRRQQLYHSYYSVSVMPDCPDCDAKEIARRKSRASVVSMGSVVRELCEHERRRNTLVVDETQRHYVESLISAV